MPFEMLKKRVSTSATGHPASIRLRTSAAKTCCYVSLRSAVIAEMAWHKGVTRVAVLLGQGDDAGKMRIISVPDGPFSLRVTATRGHGMLDLGHIEAFGSVDTKKIGIEARKIDDATLELDLPNFADHADDGEDEAEQDEESRPAPQTISAPARSEPPRPTAPKAGLPAPPPRPSPPAGREPALEVTNGAVRVVGGTRPAIHHGGEYVELTPRQAKIMACLVRALGSMIPTAVLMQKAATAAAFISDDYFALKAPLEDIGLKLTFTTKMGYTLAAK